MEKLASLIQQKTIKKVFNQRSDFIVIGLTGSVGSGLSNITKVLTSSFEDLESRYLHFIDYDDKIQELERKKVIQYAKYNWKQFDVIKARDVIVTYILENNTTYKRFIEDIGSDFFEDPEFCRKVCLFIQKQRFFEQNSYVDVESIKTEIDYFIESYRNKGMRKTLLSKNNELLEYINVLRSKTGGVYNTRTTLSLYVYTKYILPAIGYKLKEFMDGKTYTTLFQKYGNEIRFFGTLDVKQWKEKIENIDNIINFDYFYSIAKRINTFIKIRRAPATNRKSVPVQIVIDSLKNPYEFSFLKDRYSAYYTFALLNEQKKSKVTENEFLHQQYNKLYENPNHIKNEFKKFLNILIEQTQREVTLVDSLEYDYIQALKTPDKFLKYLVNRLETMDFEQTHSFEWYPEIKMVNYNWEYQKIGISKNEFSFFFSILQDPIRTFCMISGLYSFYLQDIQSSTQNADVFFENSSKTDLDRGMVYQIIKYVCLIMHPGLVPPTKVERCMQMAFCAKANSGCISRQVGAVVTDKDYNILSSGWNDVPPYRIPCIYRNLLGLQTASFQESFLYSDLELEDIMIRRYMEGYDFKNQRQLDNICEGLTPCYCFKSLYGQIMHEKEQKDSRAMHAEERAFHSCSNKGLAEGGCLFTTSSSCERCTIIANEYKIKKIYYIETYPGIAQSHVNASGAPEGRAKFIFFKGAIGVAYTKLYTPVLPLKDELELRGIDNLYYDKYFEE